MKKQKRVLKLSRETLRRLNERSLGAAHGGASIACTINCPSGTVCSCPGLTIGCTETCHTVSEFPGCTGFCSNNC